MLIADSQVHLWGADTPQRPWPAGRGVEAQKPYPVTRDMLLFEMELAKVDRIVIVPPSWEGDRNDLALEAARTHPGKFAVMGRINLADPASKALVPDWKKQPGMLGMRFTFHNEHNRHFLTDGSADWLWPAAEKAGIPLMVLVPGALDHLDRIASKHPGLKLVIDHVGLNIRQKAPTVFEDLPAVCALAKHCELAGSTPDCAFLKRRAKRQVPLRPCPCQMLPPAETSSPVRGYYRCSRGLGPPSGASVLRHLARRSRPVRLS